MAGSYHAAEVASAERFEFGANWTRFLAELNDARIAEAESALRDMLEVNDLAGLHFLDAGSGSGLSSLAARRLGASVTSFDYDPLSVRCTRELRRRYFADDPNWKVEEASVLDSASMRGLGQFDVVYSWGVLHHTGAMWQALDHMVSLVAPGGRLFIALYNDQGRASRQWRAVKKAYNRLPHFLRFLVVIPSLVALYWKAAVKDLLSLRPFASFRSENRARGMSVWHDALDWIGGLPFEVARPDDVFDFYRARGFSLARLRTVGGGQGCNEFVFVRATAEVRAPSPPPT